MDVTANALENRPRALKGSRKRLSTINFSGSFAVSFRECNRCSRFREMKNSVFTVLTPFVGRHQVSNQTKLVV